MFGAPVRRTEENETVFYVPMLAPTAMNIRLELDSTGLTPTVAYQNAFSSKQKVVLSELAKHSTLFKSPPTLESLEAITPNWGFILLDGVASLSPYTVIVNSVEASKCPCIVDLCLEGITMSRSTLKPVFRTTFIEVVNIPERIDFDWLMDTEKDSELEEVSDVASADIPSGTLTLRDPVTMQRIKRDAKQRVRAAFRAAADAREEAECMATRFYDEHDLSETESAFTEWMSSESEDENSAP